MTRQQIINGFKQNIQKAKSPKTREAILVEINAQQIMDTLEKARSINCNLVNFNDRSSDKSIGFLWASSQKTWFVLRSREKNLAKVVRTIATWAYKRSVRVEMCFTIE